MTMTTHSNSDICEIATDLVTSFTIDDLARILVGEGAEDEDEYALYLADAAADLAFNYTIDALAVTVVKGWTEEEVALYLADIRGK